MLCINNTDTDPYFNLAAEEYLLKNFTENIFMLWQNEPSVIIGKHQNVWAEVDLDFVKEKKIKLARRFSGGGTVYHDLGNLNLTFIVSSNNVDFSKFTQIMIDILSKLGINAQSDERRAINIDGLKISGSAQCIHKGRAMYHATLLFSSDLNILTTALEADPELAEKNSDGQNRFYVKSVKSPVTNMCAHVQDSIDIEKCKNFIMDYLLTKDKMNRIYTFDSKDICGINLLKENKYATSEWNWDFKKSVKV